MTDNEKEKIINIRRKVIDALNLAYDGKYEIAETEEVMDAFDQIVQLLDDVNDSLHDMAFN